MFSCFHNTGRTNRGPASIEGSGKRVSDRIILDGFYVCLSQEVL
jgi:hypothetical protein